MLIIRKDQLEVLQTALDRQNVAVVRARIEQYQPHIIHALSAIELDSVIRRAIARCRQLGAGRIETVHLMVRFLVDVGEDFDELEQVRAVLEDDGILPDERLDVLLLADSLEGWRHKLHPKRITQNRKVDIALSPDREIR